MKKSIIYVVGTALFLSACSGGENKPNDQENTPADSSATTTTTTAPESSLNEDLKYQLDLIIGNNLLVPMTIISDLKEDGKSLYHPEELNSLENASTYQDDFSRALNFGVYGVDIVYNVAHNHNEEISGYREKTLEMATSLGLESFYAEEDMTMFKEASKDDKAVSQFIFNEYHKIDDYLVSHENFETMTLVLTGGIVEGMYFTGRAIEEYGISDTKYSLLLNERKSLGQLIELLGQFKSNDKDQLLKAELEKLYESFNSFSSQEELTKEKITELDQGVIELRNKIINNDWE